MKITENVHLIRKEFYVTPDVKRYVNIYLIVGKYCYLIDSGVAGSEILIEEYLQSINRKVTDIKGVFLTHSHPDHAGAAAELKRRTDCKIYAPIEEVSWIEDVEKQFHERPIPNFFQLLPESVNVDFAMKDSREIQLEEGLHITALSTTGHSHGSMSYILNGNVIFTGDAIPVANDLPIFVDYEETIQSLDILKKLSKIQYYCPAWDEVYGKKEADIVIEKSKEMLLRLKNVVLEVEQEFSPISANSHLLETEELTEILRRAGLLQFAGNPLVIKSIEACKQF